MGDAELGDSPHHPQKEVREGKAGYGVEDVDYMPDVTCSECHMHEGSHSLSADIIALGCAESSCHSSKTNESAQEEIDTTKEEFDVLFELAEINITKMEEAREAADEAGTWNNSLNDTYDIAVFNFHLADDGSHGNHNPEYVKALLTLANDNANIVLEQFGIPVDVTVSPEDDEEDVPVDTVITVQFGQDINMTTFQLTVSGGVTGNVTYEQRHPWHR
jgi:hypothetical protein